MKSNYNNEMDLISIKQHSERSNEKAIRTRPIQKWLHDSESKNLFQKVYSEGFGNCAYTLELKQCKSQHIDKTEKQHPAGAAKQRINNAIKHIQMAKYESATRWRPTVNSRKQ